MKMRGEPQTAAAGAPNTRDELPAGPGRFSLMTAKRKLRGGLITSGHLDGRSEPLTGSRRLSLLSMTLASLLMATGCGGIELESGWLAHEISVDGTLTDWDTALTPLEDVPVSVGILNDNEYAYLCLYSRDRDIQRQIMTQGFTVWFDPEGGEEEVLGIRFPLGMRSFDGAPDGMGEPPGPGDRPPEGRAPRDANGPGTDEMRERFERTLDQLEILGPYLGGRRQMSVAELEGMEVAMGVGEGSLVYELRIPLAEGEGRPIAIETEAGSVIGVGLKTAAMTRERPEGRGGRGMPGGMGGGRGSGPMGGGRGGGPPPGGMSGRPGMSQPLSVWAKVTLATAAASSAAD